MDLDSSLVGVQTAVKHNAKSKGYHRWSEQISGFFYYNLNSLARI